MITLFPGSGDETLQGVPSNAPIPIKCKLKLIVSDKCITQC